MLPLFFHVYKTLQFRQNPVFPFATSLAASSSHVSPSSQSQLRAGHECRTDFKVWWKDYKVPLHFGCEADTRLCFIWSCCRAYENNCVEWNLKLGHFVPFCQCQHPIGAAVCVKKENPIWFAMVVWENWTFFCVIVSFFGFTDYSIQILNCAFTNQKTLKCAALDTSHLPWLWESDALHLEAEPVTNVIFNFLCCSAVFSLKLICD